MAACSSPLRRRGRCCCCWGDGGCRCCCAAAAAAVFVAVAAAARESRGAGGRLRLAPPEQGCCCCLKGCWPRFPAAKRTVFLYKNYSPSRQQRLRKFLNCTTSFKCASKPHAVINNSRHSGYLLCTVFRRARTRFRAKEAINKATFPFQNPVPFRGGAFLILSAQYFFLLSQSMQDVLAHVTFV